MVVQVAAIASMASTSSAFVLGTRPALRAVPLAINFRFGQSAGVIRNPFAPRTRVNPASRGLSLSMMAPPPARISFTPSVVAGTGGPATRSVVIVGKKEALGSDDFAKHIPMADKATLAAMLAELQPGELTSTWASEDGKAFKLILAALPEKATRNNSPFQPHAVTRLVAAAAGAFPPSLTPPPQPHPRRPSNFSSSTEPPHRRVGPPPPRRRLQGPRRGRLCGQQPR